MTSESAKGSSAAAIPVRGYGEASGKGEFDEFVPKYVQSEDAASPGEVARVWGKMYAACGLSTAAEGDKKALRCAVYVYACLNGTSREGNYSGSIVLASGKEVSASMIPAATGRMQIRRFFRGNQDESYRFFSQTGVMARYDRFVDSVSAYGISAEDAFCVADFLDGCPLFTPSQRRGHNSSFDYATERSRRNRGGKNLEAVEDSRLRATLKTTGPLNEGDSGPIDM